MATILDKDLTRESTMKHEEREIMITITQDQQINLKLKGLKSGSVSIGIDELYKQLKGIEVEVEAPRHIKVSKSSHVKTEDNPMISLYELRTENMVGNLDFNSKMILEKIICELLKREIKL